jgi:parallel beta-helix repeat protein
MNTSKVMFLVFLTIISLCAINIQSVKSQDSITITILSNGDISPSVADGVLIQKDGKVYTFMNNLTGFSLVVECSDIIIDGAGFVLSGEAEIGIDLSYTSSVTVRDVEIEGFYYYGINILESSEITIINNIIASNMRGILLVNSTQNTSSENSIVNNDVGVYLMSSSENVFRNNYFNNNHNLVVYGTKLSHFTNDMDVSNTIINKKTYYLVNEENLVINPDTFPDLGFLALVSCRNITVRNMDLTKNGQGIILAFTTYSTIMQNNITGNHNGVLLFGSSNNEVSGNSITSNYRGIQLSKSSTNNSITSNKIMDNNEGIFFFNSPQNTVVSNNVTNNSIGIGFSSASNNMIRSNYFIDNSKQVYDVSMDDSSVTNSTNYWNFAYPLCGNYWSDYTGVDVKSGENQDQEGSDEIGDTPYSIYGNNKDNYPRMLYATPLTIYVTSPENKTYNVNSVSLIYTVSESESVIGYSLDEQTNITISGSITLSDLSDGTHKLTVYAKDTEGHESSNTVYFTIAEEAETPTETEDETPTESEETEEFPIIWIAAAIGVAAVVGVALLYFLKIKKK